MAFTEIRYPHSWNNVQGNLQNHDFSGVWDTLVIPPGHYSSSEDVIAKMNESKEKDKRVQDRLKDDVSFSYNVLSRKVTVHLQNNAEVNLAHIGYMLRFSLGKVISETTTERI